MNKKVNLKANCLTNSTYAEMSITYSCTHMLVIGPVLCVVAR